MLNNDAWNLSWILVSFFEMQVHLVLHFKPVAPLRTPPLLPPTPHKKKKKKPKDDPRTETKKANRTLIFRITRWHFLLSGISDESAVQSLEWLQMYSLHFIPGIRAVFLLLCESLPADFEWALICCLTDKNLRSGWVILQIKINISIWMLVIFLCLSLASDKCWKDGCLSAQFSGAGQLRTMLRNIWYVLKSRGMIQLITEKAEFITGLQK